MNVLQAFYAPQTLPDPRQKMCGILLIMCEKYLQFLNYFLFNFTDRIT